MERNILKFLNFEMSTPTSKNFLRQEYSANLFPFLYFFNTKVNNIFETKRMSNTKLKETSTIIQEKDPY